MSWHPLQTCPFDGTRDTPGAETRPAGSPPRDFTDKMTGETCSGKSSNGKEKRPRSRRENVSVPGFFRPSPEIKIPSPEKRIPGLGISRSGPEISRQTVQKVNCSDRILHKSPVLCKKIARKSSIWAGLRKSRVTKIVQNGTICLCLQVFYDILIFGRSEFDGDLMNSAQGRYDPFVHHADGKTVPPCRGTSPEGAEGVSRPQEHNTGRIYGQNGAEKGENHFCAWEIPPALRATSPTRRRSCFSQVLTHPQQNVVSPCGLS